MLGGIQPDKLSAVFGGPDDGLPSRFLWAWPDKTPLFSLAREVASDADAQNAFARLTDLPMGSDHFGNPEPVRVRLTPEADNALEEFARDTDLLANDASGLFAGSLGKARGHVLRLSLIIEYLWWCADLPAKEPERISVDAVTAAAALVESYFIPMAERVYGDATIPAPEQAAMTLARYLRKSRLAKFNARDVRRKISGELRDAPAMKGACDALVEAGLIRSGSKEESRAGRTPLNFEVNPKAFEIEP